ncbi:uncharacterized protein G2W53_019131 [Senna tora]|uniref:Uncharacterized protein n=1 Tax=Senna tora TaxID=362788 RepID=A0A834TV05_9FABA|nr:uncharacterized protein G2W53_019131 [Senna tora]
MHEVWKGLDLFDELNVFCGRRFLEAHLEEPGSTYGMERDQE